MIFESPIQNLAVLFLLRWNFLPTRIRQPCRSTCVGFLPMGFPPIGLRRFKSETLLSLLRSNCALDSSKPMKRSQIRIWDPGENGSAYKELWIANRPWSDLSPFVFDKDEPRRWPITSLDWILNRLIIWRVWQQYGHDDTLSPAFVLGFGLIAERMLSSDDGDACKSRAVSFSSLVMIYRSSQSLVNLIYFLCLWYNHQSRHEPIVVYGWFHCLVTVNQIQAMSSYLIYISYTIEIHKRLLCLYHEDIICSIPSSVLWWHWRRLSWQQWITRRLPNKLREGLSESSHILISMKRQDPESSSTTLSSYFQSKVMPKAFWSLSYMLIANNKYVKEGHNRFHLLARKASDSRVTLHSFIEIVNNFLYLRTMVVVYFSVSCKLL